LIGAAVFVAFFLPFYSRLSNNIEEWINFKYAIVTMGRLSRFFAQFIFNVVIFKTFLLTGVIAELNISELGGIMGIAALTTAASQGIQYLALMLANREIGDKNRNVMLALSFNIVITACAAMGIALAKPLFLASGIAFGSLVFSIGILSDLRSLWAPKGGIGIFFGTFNPFHKTHLAIVKQFAEKRQLDKVYIHPTVIPKLHEVALEKGEIIIACRDKGMRIYEKTKKADVHVNYFPTGNRFYEYETRRTLIKIAIKEEKLEDTVEVLDFPEIYKKNGFYGIISHIKKRNKNKRIHALHGSDLGGMWLRSIYDESGWLYPYPVVRRDNISATAIRNGAKDMTPPVIEIMITHINNGRNTFNVNGLVYSFNRNGILAMEET